MATDFTFVGAAPLTVPAGTVDFSFGAAPGSDAAAAGTSTVAAQATARFNGTAAAAGAGVALGDGDLFSGFAEADAAAAGAAGAQAAGGTAVLGDAASAGGSPVAGFLTDATQVGGWDFADTSPTTGWAASGAGTVGTVTAQPPPGGFGRAAVLRGLTTKSSGRWYFEVSFDYVSGPSTATYIAGIVQTSRTTLDIALGQDGGITWNDSTGANVTLGFAFDADARQFWVRTSSAWLLGDPGIGGDPISTPLPAGGNYQPFVRIAPSAANVRRQFTARFTAESMVYGVPAGFAALEGIPGQGTGAAVGTGVAAAQGQALSTTADAAAAGSSPSAAQGLAARVGTAAAPGTSTTQAAGLRAAIGDAAAPGSGVAQAQARSIATTTGAAAGSADVTSMAVLEGLAAAAGAATLTGAGATRVLFLAGLHVLELRPDTTAREADTALVARTEEVSTI